MTKIKKGVFVKYNNELGLVKEVDQSGLRCWWHSGGTTALIAVDMVESVTVNEAIGDDFDNWIARASLLERYQRLQDGGDVSDLIDTYDVRKGIKDMLEEISVKY